MTLTDQEHAALVFLVAPGRRWATLGGVAAALGTSRQGAARTLASLVRKGQVERGVGTGVTIYRAIREDTTR